MHRYLTFWGKARPATGSGVGFHPLAAHNIDVAATAAQLDAAWPIGLPRSTLNFLVALHDIGKFSQRFQAKAMAAWPEAALGPFPGPQHDPGHDTTGFALLAEGPIQEAIAPVFGDWLHGEIAPILRAVTGHHGRPPREGGSLPLAGVMCGRSREAALAFVHDLIALFAPEPLPLDLACDNALAWRLAGLTTLADWIGSSQRHFAYAHPDDLLDLRRYWEDRAIPAARKAVAASGLAPGRAAPFAGATVAWVRNTVDDAIAACDALREAGLEPMLFHARFAMADRLRIEEAVLARFGRSSADRRGVLVATQVIEQSLDLDFDLMVSDLAPVDLLIQRAGRLWRHERGPRPVGGPELLLLSPDPVAEPGADWLADHRGTAAVYRDPALLWRGARALLAAGSIDAPGGLRALIEAAEQGEEPEGLRAAAARAQGKRFADAATARQNLLSVEDGYAEDAGLWASEERTPTRLEDRPQVTLRLARLQGGVVVPYAEDVDEGRAWALSEVSVAEHRIGEVAIPAELGAAAEAARARWGRWEREAPRIRLAILGEERPGRWRPLSGQSYRYDVRQGLCWEHPGPSG